MASRRPCDVINIGPIPLMRKGLGLGLPKKSGQLAAFNKVLKALKKSGQLDRLKKKWWSSECSRIRSDSRMKDSHGKYFLKSKMLNCASFFVDFKVFLFVFYSHFVLFLCQFKGIF